MKRTTFTPSRHVLPKVSSEKTVSEWADIWLASKTARVKETTLNKYQNTLFWYILPHLGALRPEEADAVLVDEYAAFLLREGGQNGQALSPKTVSDTVTVLKAILRFAAVSLRQALPNLGRVCLKKESQTVDTLSMEECKNLITVLQDSKDPRDAGILLCLFTGLRVGEVCALRWDCIQLNEKNLMIQKTLQRIQCKNTVGGPRTKVVLTSPKSSCSCRMIPLPDYVVQLLEPFYSPGECFLLSGCPDRLVEPRNMQGHFRRVLQKSKVHETHFHVLRHTFATRCIAAGVDMKSLCEILGHADVRITMNKYVHPTMEEKREGMVRLQQSLMSV